jgi:hypothetical protein
VLIPFLPLIFYFRIFFRLIFAFLPFFLLTADLCLQVIEQRKAPRQLHVGGFLYGAAERDGNNEPQLERWVAKPRHPSGLDDCFDEAQVQHLCLLVHSDLHRKLPRLLGAVRGMQ